MPIAARYVHTNLVARDWRSLARFYVEVFGCTPVPPERDLSGEFMERLTGIPGAHLRGMHLRLPGFGDSGPTLEVFEYQAMPDGLEPAVNRPGFGHIAFLVDDVETACQAVIAAGGRPVGEISRAVVAGRNLTAVYVTDPEGNVLELQSWDSIEETGESFAPERPSRKPRKPPKICELTREVHPYGVGVGWSKL